MRTLQRCVRRWLPSLLGVLLALLLVRLLLRLLAARPDNPVVALLLAVSQPLVAPLRWLDAGQPQFGATLELSTLTLLLLLPLIGYGVWRLVGGSPPESS